MITDNYHILQTIRTNSTYYSKFISYELVGEPNEPINHRL